MKRVTPKTLADRQNNKGKYADLPKLKDILVDLSVRNSPKVVRKLRLIGEVLEFAEMQDKVRVPGTKETKRVPFPDAHRNGLPTRIGHDDPSLCPWRKLGYISSRRFAQRCLEEQEDGTWVHKILVKGPSVFDAFFDWQLGRREENDPEISTFLGGDIAPPVKIQALADSTKLGGVDYRVFVNPKDMELTEDHINLLRAVRVPSADELNAFRNEFNEAREYDPDMPEWRDYYEFGHDIRRIFKYTPPVTDEVEEARTSAPSPSAADEDEDSTEAESSTADSEVDLDISDVNWDF
jgi:hypothetical protein